MPCEVCSSTVDSADVRWTGADRTSKHLSARDFLDDLLARPSFEVLSGPWRNSPRSDDHSGWSQRL
ncbi:MAG TPA: hypothetical protein VJB57_18590 [Dehalococcoidia bacterium]|nr:hypothetical protein [Dehalococcoidia bacterium]